jgi:uncharacterized membrane protein
LSAAGILLYFDSPNLALEAVLLFVTNLVAIILAASATFFALGMRPMLKDKNQVAGFGLGAIATFTAASFLAVELGSVTLQRFAEARQEQELSAAIVEWAGDNTVEIAQLDVSRTDDPKTVALWLII